MSSLGPSPTALADAAREELARFERAVAAAEQAAADATAAYEMSRPRNPQLMVVAGAAGDELGAARAELETARVRLKPVFDAEEREANETEDVALRPHVGNAAIDSATTAIAATIAECRRRLVDEVHALEDAIATTNAARKRATWLANVLKRPTEYAPADFRRILAAALNEGALAPRDGYDRNFAELTIAGDSPRRHATLTIHGTIP
jgi:hypothetical protein